MNDDLIAKGKQLVAELGEDAETSAKWMSHYVAELMERAASDDEVNRQSAANICAGIILKLWNIKEQKRIVQVERDLQIWFKQRYRDSSNERYEKLRAVLADLENASEIDDDDVGLTLHALREVEDDLMDMWLVVEASANPTEEQFNEISRVFDKADAETHSIRERLTKVFPDFADLSLDDITRVRDRVLAALRMVHQLRDAILWQHVKEDTQAGE